MRLIYIDDDAEQFPDDIDRMVLVAQVRGYELSRNDARRAWEDYSESMCATWKVMPAHDQVLFDLMMRYLKVDSGS